VSSQRQYISTGSPFEPKVGISRAVRSGRIIAVTGTAPLSKDGKTVAKGDAAGQARRCLEIIQSAIEGLGGKLSDVVHTRILLIRIEDWERSRQSTASSLAASAPRTRSCRLSASSTRLGCWRSRRMLSWRTRNP
jgi:enamine deaminase RidA (YjgF/YER057c/UK114 family)